MQAQRVLHFSASFTQYLVCLLQQVRFQAPSGYLLCVQMDSTHKTDHSGAPGHLRVIRHKQMDTRGADVHPGFCLDFLN